VKRLVIATFFGLCAGGLCASALFAWGILPYSRTLLAWVLLNRAVMGFAIGASALRLRWVWNGVVLGLAVGSIFSGFLYMRLGPTSLPFLNFFGNAVFGLLIEFFTTVVFKQPASAPGE
jgi:hypothetical protein